jgi:succinate dehydrogenase flavin-adding protein (antitoxin of CptAB toxin-antitoxin module)
VVWAAIEKVLPSCRVLHPPATRLSRASSVLESHINGLQQRSRRGLLELRLNQLELYCHPQSVSMAKRQLRELQRLMAWSWDSR